MEITLDTGRYANAEEVLVIALQLLTRLDTKHQAWIEETRQQIAIGIAELDQGKGIDGVTAMNESIYTEITSGEKNTPIMNFLLAPSSTRDLDRLSQYFFETNIEAGGRLFKALNKQFF
jgi:Arc/MetJ-type ribon-helix-helix transcriptional regulator